jgi:hypothetical protein
MEEMEGKAKESTKSIFKHIVVYGVIVIVSIASFIIGFTYHKLTSKNEIPPKEINRVFKKDVSVAIDETNNLIIINNETGDYTLFQDSIGNTIFNLYAKTVWGQHNQIVTNVETKEVVTQKKPKKK